MRCSRYAQRQLAFFESQDVAGRLQGGRQYRAQLLFQLHVRVRSRQQSGRATVMTQPC